MPPELAASVSLANGWRFDSRQSQWFDFYNCRVTLPERGRYFYCMPYAAAGSKVDAATAGLRFYDGGNGGPGRRSICGDVRIADGAWKASPDRCEVRWRDKRGGENLFSEDRIVLTGPVTRWDVTIESWLFDRDEPETDPRRLRLEERGMLRRVPFIHRVPRMKGFASGVIEQGGERYEFERGVVYQAKNHGVDFPREWTWIHANDFAEDGDLAFEVASLEHDGGVRAAMLRIVRPGRTIVLSDWAGDEVRLERAGDEYHFRARSADGSTVVSGLGRHDADRVLFHYDAPGGERVENDESFVGSLVVTVNGKPYHATMPALGKLRRVDK